MSDTEKATVLFDWTDTAQKQRWSNFPDGAFKHAGLMWGNMSEPQRNAWLAVMQATLSTEGYNRVIAEWNGDDVVAAQDGGGGRPSVSFGTAYYYIALIGTPSETDPWQWQWGGHHVTVNATIVGPNIALTPSFIGVQPVEYTNASGATVRALGDIEDEAFALVNSLDATQQQTAILGSSAIDMILGPGQDGKTIQPEGIQVSSLNADQQKLLLDLVSVHVNMLSADDAAVKLAEVKANLAESWFAWYGPTTNGEASYYRIQGPTIFIEYSPQSMGGAAIDHIHAMFRDPTNDYGAGLLK